MGLKGFHIVFVSASSLLAFAFAGWALHAWRVQDDGAWLALGVASLAAGVGLIVYGFWFWRKITTREEEERRRRRILRRVRVLPVLLGAWIAGTPDASACSVCYGDASGPLIDAARLGVYFLFGLVALVQVGFASFFFTLWRRARRNNKGSE